METSFPFIVFHREQQMDGRAGGREEEGQRFMGYLNSSFIQGSREALSFISSSPSTTGDPNRPTADRPTGHLPPPGAGLD